MWTKKKSCSPSSSIGELIASTSRKIPSQKRNCRQRGTGLPAPRERPRAAVVANDDSTVGTSWSGARFQFVRSEAASGTRRKCRGARAAPRAEQSTACTSSTTTSSRARSATVEARYLGKLGFRLVARYGRSASARVTAEPGVPWERLERDGFKLRLTELQRGSLNVVLQPGPWRVPRVDHLGVVLVDEDDYDAVLDAGGELEPARAGAQQPAHVRLDERRLPDRGAPAAPVDRRPARRAATSSRLAELQLRDRASRAQKATALADILGLDAPSGSRRRGRRDASCSFVAGRARRAGPSCYAERFDRSRPAAPRPT